MRVLCLTLAAVGALGAAGASAYDHPSRAPAQLRAASPRSQISPYWNASDEGQPAHAPSVSEAYPAEVGHEGAYEGGPDGNCGDDCYQDAMCNECCDDCCYNWYGSLAALIMTRDRGNKVFTTYDNNDINNQVFHTQEADVDWEGGFEFTVGRRICCTHGLEFTYWTLDRLESSANYYSATDEISTPLNVGFLEFDGQPAANFFDSAREHRISRENEVHSLELNLVQLPFDSCGGLNVSYMLGVRYFRFNEDLTFASVAGGSEFGDDPANEVYLEVDAHNSLIGFQMGARADYSLTSGFRLFGIPKVGVYYNRIEEVVRLRTGNGVDGLTVAPATAYSFPRDGAKDDVAFLAQLDLGAEYDLTCNCTVFGGYRAVAISGVALSDQQIPAILADVPEWEDIDSNGHVILHGAFGGVEFRY